MAETEQVVEVPPYFLCPISLQMMKDPVTISTGITYDRDNIEQWLFSLNRASCPVTKLPLTSHTDMITPNVTLRRLIQSWCTLHASHANGIQRLPTPKSPLTQPHLSKLLKYADTPHLQSNALQTLASLASTNQSNKRCMEAAGTHHFLASLLNKSLHLHPHQPASDLDIPAPDEFRNACAHDALAILYTLNLSESALKSLTTNPQFLNSLTHLMHHGSYQSRAYAIMLLESMLQVADPSQLINLPPRFFSRLVHILTDQISPKASKATLKALISVCPWGKNRIKAVEAGAATVLIDLLLDSSNKRDCELTLTVLDYLCQCAEGRAELLKHGAGLAIISKKILRVSQLASEKAVRILFSVSKFSGTPAVLLEMLQFGVVAKLCLVLQVECGSKTKERAREILRLNARAWRKSSCIPNSLISSYPF